MSVPVGIVCSPDDYMRSIDQPYALHCLTRGDTIGLTVIAIASFASVTAIACVFFVILRNVVRRLFKRPRQSLQIFRLPIDIMMFSLLLAEALQAIGGIVNVSWIQSGKVEEGNFCRAQGIIQNIGETGVAFSTLAIAIHTFLVVWVGQVVRSITITCVVVLASWLLIAVLVVIGNTTNSNFIAPTPYWCWIRGPLVWKIFNEYLWFWIALLVSLLVYFLLYFWMRGKIAPAGPPWWRMRRVGDEGNNTSMIIRRKAYIMALYPLVYTISVLPLSFARWIGFVQEANYGGNKVPAAATFAVTSIFALSGFFNVVLVLTTRPDIKLFGGLISESQAGLLPPTATTPHAISLHTLRVRDDDCNEGKLPY